MTSQNKKKTVPATLGLMLLSLSVVSLIAISAPNDAGAQGSLGLETEQSGQGGSGAQPADTGAATLNDTTTGQAGAGDAEPTACAPIQTGGGGQNATTTTGGGGSTNTTSGGEGTFDEGVSVGGTSAFDDYDADAEG